MKTMKNWIRELESIMIKLRSQDGCPWDREQTHKSLKKYLVEEAYELFDAIEKGDDVGIIDELGDLLLQIIFHCQIGREESRFDLQDVAKHCCIKMIRRHPHVFGNKVALNSTEVLKQWDQIKKLEQRNITQKSILDGIPRSFPPLTKAKVVQTKASKVGFDWNSSIEVLNKVQEELEELKVGVQENNRDSIREELGDLIFAVVNLCRFQEESAEDLLFEATEKFSRRFRFIEAHLIQQGKKIDECSFECLETLWQKAKTQV